MRISRRGVLCSAGVTIALPWLEAINGSSRVARAQTAVKRALFMFSPNGYIREEWVPSGTEESFTLNNSLKALEPHIQDIVVLDGVSNTAARSGPGDGHQRGMGSMLTGTQLLSGNNKGAGLAGGISVDQEMVKQLQPQTKFPSLELGVDARLQGTVWGYSNYADADKGLPLENDPAKAFDRLFADAPTGGEPTPEDTAAIERLRQDRKSVLDAVITNYQQLNPRLGIEDRAKLESHLQTIRELETRIFLDPAGGGGMSCTTPEAPAGGDFAAKAKQQMDLMAMAVACDLARIGTIQFSHSFGDPLPIEDIREGHHELSHDENEKVKLARLDTWYAEQFAYFIDKLKNIPEGDGTVLDNTVMLWHNEVSKGWEHDHDNMPYVLAGRAAGALKSGRFLQFDGDVPHNNLLVSLLNIMDVPATTFGNPKNCTGALPGLAAGA